MTTNANDTRTQILSKIQNALLNNSLIKKYSNIDSINYSFFSSNNQSIEITFANELNKAGGHFIFCESINEFYTNALTLFNKLKCTSFFCNDAKIQQYLITAGIPFCSGEYDFNDMEVGITDCEFLIAQTGSVLVSSKQTCGRKMFVFPPIHIIISFKSQLVYDINTALKLINKKYIHSFPSQITLISGPSRTADIEKTLILGAHGPKNLFVFFINK